MTKEQKLDELIKEIEKKDKARGLSDEYLREHHYMTREELGIGEYSYGVIMIPTDFVLDYLKELQEQQEENKKKDNTVRKIISRLDNDYKRITETLQDGKHCDDYSRDRLKAYRTKTREIKEYIEEQYFERKAEQ